MAAVPQSLGPLTEVTLGENIGLPGRLADHDNDVQEIAERLKIGHLLDRPTTGASLGELQRAEIARALIRSPALLLSDKPSSHQDLERLHLVWRLISETAAAGTAVIAATHDPDGFTYADRILGLQGGKLVQAQLFPPATEGSGCSPGDEVERGKGS